MLLLKVARLTEVVLVDPDIRAGQPAAERRLEAVEKAIDPVAVVPMGV